MKISNNKAQIQVEYLLFHLIRSLIFGSCYLFWCFYLRKISSEKVEKKNEQD